MNGISFLFRKKTRISLFWLTKLSCTWIRLQDVIHIFWSLLPLLPILVFYTEFCAHHHILQMLCICNTFRKLYVANKWNPIIKHVSHSVEITEFCYRSEFPWNQSLKICHFDTLWLIISIFKRSKNSSAYCLGYLFSILGSHLCPFVVIC